LDDVKADDSARRDLKMMMMISLFLVADPVPLLFVDEAFQQQIR
jgi:hypothetical protein